VSNHDGSHMLNDVIALLRREGVFDRLGKAHSQRIVSEMVSRAYEEHDCRHAEILEGPLRFPGLDVVGSAARGRAADAAGRAPGDRSGGVPVPASSRWTTPSGWRSSERSWVAMRPRISRHALSSR